MKNNDFDFIKSQFDEARVNVPDELDKRVQSKLNNVRPVRIKYRQKPAFKAGISIAACIAVFVMVITTVNVSDIDYRIKSDDNSPSSATQLENFDNYKNVKEYIEDSQKKEKQNSIKSRIKSAVSPELVEYMDASQSTKADSFDSAETYVQEKGVDEADIIKTNGRDIYYLNQSFDEKSGVDKRTINVIETKKGKSTVANTIELDDVNSVIEDMFVSDDKLVVNCTSFSGSTVEEKIAGADSATKAIVYDISDVENPTEINSFEQSGYYTSSRLVGNTFYIVSSYSINSSKNYVPLTCSGEGDSEKLNAKDIYYAKNGVGTDYIVVTALDVNTCETIGTTKAVLGCGGEVYGNKDYLYVYGSDYSGKEPNTTIAKISLKNGVKFCDYVKINGTVDSRYSFAEKDNHLCVFATETVKDKTCNYLYVLDSNLKQIYKSEPFAKDESIKAVKYVDDYAYVITYEQTDPLFIINLSNVKKPKFMGNVEIDGFSSMLVNVGDNQLLGVGYNTYFDNDVEVIDGLKFVLFDVSNSLEPKVLDEKVYKDLSSEAQYNSKAFVENKEKGYYAVPIVNVKGTQKGAIVVSVKGGKIVEKENYKAKLKTTSYGGMNTRVTYIDDYYYVVDNNLDVSSFELK